MVGIYRYRIPNSARSSLAHTTVKALADVHLSTYALTSNPTFNADWPINPG